MPDRTLLDPFDVWRALVALLERTGNRAANSAMTSKSYRQGMNRALLACVVTQEMGHSAARRLLQALDVPTRDDIAALGERLRSIDERLMQVSMILELSHPEAAAAMRRPMPSPPRTRKAPPVPQGVDKSAGEVAATGANARKKVAADKVATGRPMGRKGAAKPRRRTSRGSQS